MEKTLSFLKCLADETRLKMFKLLLDNECCVCQMTVILDKSQSSISQHLSYFKELDLVNEKKDSKWSYYSINRKKYDEYLAGILTLNSKTFAELNLENMEERIKLVKEEDVCETRKRMK